MLPWPLACSLPVPCLDAESCLIHLQVPEEVRTGKLLGTHLEAHILLDIASADVSTSDFFVEPCLLYRCSRRCAPRQAAGLDAGGAHPLYIDGAPLLVQPSHGFVSAQVLEKARIGRLLGSALEARILLHVDDEDLRSRLAALDDAKNGADPLRYAFIVSEV